MTVYTKTMMESLAEVRGLQEDNIDLMRKAAGGAAQTIKMKDGKLKMDMFTASAIMQVYDKVNPANQKKMAVMINKGTKAGMAKLQDFAMKQVKSGYGEEVEEEVDLDEDASNFKSAVARIKKAKSVKDLKKLEKSFERVYKQTGALTDKEFGQLDDMISDKLVKLGEEVEEEVDEARQLKDPKKEMMVSKAGKVEVIDKEDWNKFKKKGYVQAEESDLMNAVIEQLAKIKGNSPADKGRKAAVEDDIERAEKKGDKKEVKKLKEDDLDEGKFQVKTAATKKGKITVTDFDNLKDAEKHLAAMEKKGQKGIISKDGKPVKEDVELDEAPKYDLYHKDFSSAMQHAYKMAKKMYGITVDDNEIDSKVATGPSKPSSGKTNSYILDTNKKQKVHIQVANLDNKKYELNMYFN